MAIKYNPSLMKVRDENGNLIDIPAIKGKSAYEYAVDGGFQGTETEFAEKLAFLMGYSVYGYVDENMDIVLKGNVTNGAHFRLIMEDGSTIDIGQAVFYYSVFNNLTNCTNGNSATEVTKGGTYSATISANNGYELTSVTVTMGGTDISDSVVSGGVISIASVTGDIVITAVAEEIVVEIINQIPISIDSSGAVYNGIGYKQNVRLKSDGVTEDTVSANTDLTGYIPAVVGNEVYIKDMVLTPTETTGGQYLTIMRLYDASFTMLKAFSYGNTFNPTEENGVYKYTVPSDYPNTTYIRMQAQTINDASVITVNQPIT